MLTAVFFIKAIPVIHVKKHCTIEISIPIWQVFMYHFYILYNLYCLMMTYCYVETCCTKKIYMPLVVLSVIA